MGLKQFLKKYYEYDKEDIKDEKLNVDDYKLFKILDDAIEGNIDFDKLSFLLSDNKATTISVDDFDDLVEFKEAEGDKVDLSSVAIFREIIEDDSYMENIVKYSKLWDKAIKGKVDYLDMYVFANNEYEKVDLADHDRALDLYLLPKGKLTEKQNSNLIAFKELVKVASEDPDLYKEMLVCMQQNSEVWDKVVASEQGDALKDKCRSIVEENIDNEAYLTAFNIYMNKQKRDNPKKFEKQNSRAVVVEELHEQKGELPVANYKAQSQSMRFDKRLEVHQVETEDTKTKSETNKNEKQSQNYKFLVEAGNVMD